MTRDMNGLTAPAIRRLLALTAFFCFASLISAHAAPSITVSNPTGDAGSNVTFTVQFNPGTDNVASLQFDLSKVPSISTVSVTPGTIIAASNKVGGLGQFLIDGDKWRFMVWQADPFLTPMNLTSGMLFTVTIKIAPGTPGGAIPLTLSNIIVADPAANPITGTIATNGILTVTPGDVSAPTVPTGLSANAVSSSQINLSWTASTDDVGVAGYGIFRGNIFVSSTTGTSFQHTGLTASTSYTYKIRAYDANNNLSAFTSNVSATTPAAPDTTPPTVPAGLSASAVSSSQINLSWTASTDGVGVAGYGILRGNIFVSSVTGTSFQHTGLTASTSYTYKIRAYDAAGNLSAFTANASATTQAAATGPTITVGSASGAAGDTVSFTVIFNPGPDDVASLQFDLSKMPSISTVSVTPGTIIAASNKVGGLGQFLIDGDKWRFMVWQADPFLTPMNLTSGVLFTVNVKIALGTPGGAIPLTLSNIIVADPAANPITNFSASGGVITVTGSSADTTPPTVPAGLSASAVSSSQINLSWTASTDDVGVAGYGIFRGNIFVSSVTGTSFQHTGLTASTSYTYKIRAYDAAGNLSAFTANASATTQAAATGPTITVGSASGAAGDTVSFTVIFNPGPDDVASLQFDLSKVPSISTVSVTPGTIIAASNKVGGLGQFLIDGDKWRFMVWQADPFLTPMNLTSGVLFTVNVKIAPGTPGGAIPLTLSNIIVADPAANPITNFSASGGVITVTGSSADTTPPSVPTALSASAVSSSQINLSWTASTDGVGVAGYGIFRGNIFVSSVTGTSFQHTGLTASTSYTYKIRAYDAAGNLSAFTANVSATTSAGADTTAPSVPTALSANAVSSSQINLSWTASTDGVGVAGYGILRGNIFVSSVTGTSFQHTGLTASTSYTYKIRAYDAAGNLSAFTANVSATTQGASITAPTLSGGSASGAAGNTVSFPINFNPGPTAVASLQFDVVLPPSISTVSITPGTIIAATNKVGGTGPTLIGGNTWRFMVWQADPFLTPMNLTSGVLFTVNVKIAPGTSAGTIPLNFSNVVIAAPDASSIAGGTHTGVSITVTGTSTPPPSITSAGTASGNVGILFSYQIAATNSPTSYGATGLPAGLSVNTGTGLISGTPTNTGTSIITLSASNAGGTTTKSLTLTVAAPVTAPTLVVGNISGSAGEVVSLPISFNPGLSSVEALQFDLVLPAGVTPGSVTPGLIVTSAGKIGTANPNLITGNLWRFIVFADITKAQSPLASGQLFTAQLTISPSVSVGVLNLPITGVLYSNASGQSLASGNNQGGTLTILAGGIIELPDVDLSSCNGRTYGIRDNISFTYPATGVNFTWNITEVGSPAGSPAKGLTSKASRFAAGAFGTTSAPSFSLASQPMTPGVYTLSVTVTDVSGLLPPKTGIATITLVGGAIGVDLSTVKVYPNPWKSGHSANPYITFENLTVNSKLQIFSVSGHQVYSVDVPGGNNVLWYLDNDSGDKVASGIYVYLITDNQGHKSKGKLAIVK